MKFICRNKPVLRILEVPPELMTDHRNVECRFRFWCILNGEDDSGGCEEENSHNHKWNYSPRKFYLSAAVDLSRLACWVGPSSPKSKQSNRQHPPTTTKIPPVIATTNI